MERIKSVVGDLVYIYNIKDIFVDKYEPWMSISASVSSVTYTTTNGLNGYTPGQLIFFYDIIIPKKHKADWELLRQKHKEKLN